MKKIFLSILLFHTCVLYGQSNDWASLSQEVDGFVHCLTVYDNSLIAGGHFTRAGNHKANKIASWDGTTWTSLGNGLTGGFNPFVTRAIVHNNALYVVGSFDSAGTTIAKNIAKWDGAKWSALGTGSNNTIFSIAVYQDDLYVGGLFDSIGGMAANHIAKWNGSNWQALSTGIDGANVNDLYVFQNELYAIGNLDSAGNVSCNNIARWNGSSWNSVASGLGSGNSAMIEWKGGLLVGSEFRAVFPDFFYESNFWNGTSWSLFSQHIFPIREFLVFDNKLYCSGGIGAAAPPGVSLVAVLNDTIWETVGTGVNNYIQGLCEYKGELYCGGYFNKNQGADHNYIARLTSTTAINQGNSESVTVTVYPNPFLNELTIKVDLLELTDLDLNIFDALGRQLFSKKLTQPITTISGRTLNGVLIWELTKDGVTIKTGKILSL